MKRIRSIVSIIFALTLVLSAIPLSLSPAGAATERSGWFYDQLTDTEKVFYEAIASLDLASGTDIADLTDSTVTGRSLTQEQLARYVSGNSILTAEFKNASAAFVNEHPTLFYVDYDAIALRVGRNSEGTYLAYLCSGSQPDYYRFDEFSTQADVAAGMAELDAKATEIANGALLITGETDEETTVERIRYVHNEIIAGSRYVYPEDTANGELVFTAYGCLILGESVCEGYAESTKIILNKIGIECELISGLGKELNDLTAQTERQSHMWNAVKVGSKWYGLDVTWDDPISVKRVTVGEVSTPVTDENGNYVYNDLCREKYFLLGSDTFANDHIEDGRIYDLGREFDLPVLSETAYGLGADDSGLQVKRLTLFDLRKLYDAGTLSADQYILYAGYADMEEYKFVVKYGTTDTTISYDETNIIGTVLTHTENGITKTYTVIDADIIEVKTDDGQGNITTEEINAFMSVKVDPQYAQFTVPYHDITITKITGDRNPYYGISYNNMNEGELNEQGLYLVYNSEYLDFDTGEYAMSKWTPFYEFRDTPWATDIPGMTIVVGSGNSNFFAVADFYPRMLDEETTNWDYLMFGNSPYKHLMVYDQLTDWLYSDGKLNTDIFIEASEPQKGGGTIYAPPYVRIATPSQSSITRPGKTYDVVVEYDEPLKLASEDAVPTYSLYVSAIAEFYKTTALEYVKISDFAWDGEKTITFKFTPSPMYNDNNCQYSFTFPGLVGKYSNIAPRYYTILVEQPAIGLTTCPRCPPTQEFFTMGTPILLEDENIDNITYYDGSVVTDNAKFGLTLVASKTDEITTEIMEQAVEEELNTEVLASSTYNIKLNLRNCQTPKVAEGQKITIGLPYPTGYGPENEGVVFKAYHYVVEDDGTYVAEELDCYIGEYGLVVYVSSFSPFAVVVLEKSEEAPQNKSVYAVSSEGGTVSPSGIATYAAGDTVSYTFTPDTDYVLESVLVNGTESIELVSDGVLTLDYANLADSTQISAVFTAVSVIELEEELDFTPEFVQVSPHVVSEDWVTVRASCLEAGYRYTYCMSCDEHEEIERLYDVPALASHTFGEWGTITAPTATTDGEEERICSVCNASEQRAIPALGEETTQPDTQPPEGPTEPDTQPPEGPTEPDTQPPEGPQPEQDEPEKSFFEVIKDLINKFLEWIRNLFK